MIDRGRLAIVGGAIGIWILTAAVDVFSDTSISDIPVYEAVAERVAAGEIPYRDFTVEYPPLAVGLMVVARVAGAGNYAVAFSVLMLLALIAVAMFAMATARALGMSRRRELLTGGVVAALPLLLGDFIGTRFDLAVAAVTAGALWAAVTGRFRWAWGFLGAAVALKLAPIVLVPVLAIWQFRAAGWQPTVRHAGLALGAVVATFVPFVIGAQDGVADLFRYHIDRPLQIESMGASYLLGLHALADIRITVVNSFGSQNLVGTGPDAISTISTWVGLLGILAVLATFMILLRRSRDGVPPQLAVAAFAAVLAVAVSTGKVLSPQFLIWLVPVCLLIGGRYRRVAFAGTVAVLVVTHVYFPDRYWDLVALDTPSIGLLVLRNALLIALVASVWPRPAVDAPGHHAVVARRSLPE